jgi:hypothetical protein
MCVLVSHMSPGPASGPPSTSTVVLQSALVAHPAAHVFELVQ